MKPFRSPADMLDAHELMFGAAGRQCAEIVLRWATTLFAVPLDALNIRVVLAPVELGPYNRHAGYHYGGEGKASFILGNRHVVDFEQGTLVLVQKREFITDDFVVHELTHARQAQLLAQHAGEKAWQRKRGGAHRDRGWYAAIQRSLPEISRRRVSRSFLADRAAAPQGYEPAHRGPGDALAGGFSHAGSEG